MVQNFTVAFLLFSFAICSSLAQTNPFAADTAPPKKMDGWKLAWSDEFDSDGHPNPSHWNFENGFVRNRELQWYQADNAFCKGGLLVIEGRKEKVKNPQYEATSNDWKKNREYAEYTASSLTTSGLGEWMFGRFEIRARLDTSMGLWPAIWTLGVDGEWPSNGEIDLLEYYRVDNKPHILANVAWGTNQRYNAKWDSQKTPLEQITKNDREWAKKFHVWRMDWDNDSIKLFLDDVLLNTTPLSETVNPDGKNPFRQPHFLLLNLAIGQNGGDPSQTKFPVMYEVDYVRVYQK